MRRLQGPGRQQPEHEGGGGGEPGDRCGHVHGPEPTVGYDRKAPSPRSPDSGKEPDISTIMITWRSQLSRRRRRELSLVFGVGDLLCALALRDVVETIRPLPVQPLAGSLRHPARRQRDPRPRGARRGHGQAARRRVERPCRFVTTRTGGARVRHRARRRRPARRTRRQPPAAADARRRRDQARRRPSACWTPGRCCSCAAPGCWPTSSAGGARWSVTRTSPGCGSCCRRALGMTFDDKRDPQLAEVLRVRADPARPVRPRLPRPPRHRLEQRARRPRRGGDHQRDILLPQHRTVQRAGGGGPAGAGPRPVRRSGGCGCCRSAAPPARRRTRWRWSPPTRVDPAWDVSIVGLDVNRAALRVAAAGRYSRWSLRETPAVRAAALVPDRRRRRRDRRAAPRPGAVPGVQRRRRRRAAVRPRHLRRRCSAATC